VLPPVSVIGMWQKSGAYAVMMPQIARGQTMLILLCLLAGFAALAGMAAAAASLLFGIGMGALLAALGCGVVAVAASCWAAMLAFGAPPAPGAATATGP